MNSPHPAFPSIPGQRGLATYRQLREAGWTESAVRHARTTLWQTPFPSVVAPHRGPLDAPTRLAAAALWAGPAAVLTGVAGLRELDLPVLPSARATFVVPVSGRARATATTRVVRSARPVVPVRRAGCVAIAPAVRSLADAAVHESVRARDLEALAIGVLQRGLGTPDELEAELWQRPRAKVSDVLKGLLGFRGGAWSRPEVALREVVESDPAMPALLTNVRLESSTDGRYLGTPDGYLDEVATAIQVHSRQHHQGFDDQGGDRWASTVEKDAPMVAAGIRVVGVAPWTLYSRPTRFLNQLRQVVALGPPSPAPAVRVVQDGAIHHGDSRP
jgi:hypothetical protein